MSKRRGFPEAPIAFAIGVGVGMLSLGVLSKLSLLPTEQDVDHYKEVRDFVLDRSVDEPAPEELVREALTGMVGSLDEYSRYLSSDTETSSFNRETQGSFTGIGVVFEGPIEGGRVLFPMGGSPAEEARAKRRIGSITSRTAPRTSPSSSGSPPPTPTAVGPSPTKRPSTPPRK